VTDMNATTNVGSVKSRLDAVLGGLARRTLFKLRTPEQLARKLVTWSDDPARSADRSARQMAALAPTHPVDVLGNYLRGLVLFGNDDRIWWSHDQVRGIITSESAHVSKRVRTYARRDGVTTRFDTDLEAIIEGCRQGREGTWLTPRVVELYMSLADLGFVTSVGTYIDGALVGGNWGILVGSTYGLQSMFHTENHAGAVAMAAAVDRLAAADGWEVIDVGQVTPNFERFGAFECTIEDFYDRVMEGLREDRAT
jgi:leucyl/phenylalanyl-tRNA--protein transferase